MNQVNTAAGTFNAVVYPNPAIEKATLKFYSTSISDYNFEITDVLGQIVSIKNGKSIEGINMVEIDLNTFSKGIYILNLMIDDQSEQLRMVVE